MIEGYDFKENNMIFCLQVDGAASGGDSVNEKVENEENEEKVEKQEKQQRPRSNSGSRFLTDQVRRGCLKGTMHEWDGMGWLETTAKSAIYHFIEYRLIPVYDFVLSTGKENSLTDNTLLGQNVLPLNMKTIIHFELFKTSSII